MLIGASLVFTSRDLEAQRIQRAPARAGAPAQGGGLDRQFRQRLAEVVKRRLNLNDAQMQQLGQVNNKYERQRMQLNRQERRARQALRREVLAGDSANQSNVGSLMDQLIRLQRQRIDLTESEQKELAGFMTPTQRAQYFGIQDDLRRRVDEIRRQRQQRSGGEPAP
jgi:Spy/CpxP family protein refolding chaperone